MRKGGIKRRMGGAAAAALLLAAAAGRAEEAGPPPRDWKAGVYAGADYATGNTREQAFRYGGDFEKKDEGSYRYKLKLAGKYRETATAVAESKAELSGEMRRMLNEHWFASGTLSALHDDVKEISSRVQLGPGFGRYLTDTERLTADVSTGLLYVYERASGMESGYLAWRLSQWFDWRITSAFRWWFGTEWFVDTEDPADYLVVFKTGIDSRINSHFSLITMAINEYDSRPEGEKVENNDFELSVGIRYTF